MVTLITEQATLPEFPMSQQNKFWYIHYSEIGMDQANPSTYFMIVVFLQNNAEITVLHTVLNVLA